MEGPALARCAVVRRALLQLYRLAILVAIAWILREHAVRTRVESLRPLTLGEVQALLPSASRIEIDESEREGWYVIGANGARIGYVLQTAPVSDAIIGYRGSTNTLVAFDEAARVLGVRIRASQDTVDHVDDVRRDRSFLKTWNGRTWDEVAGRTPEEEGIEGVSGASMTSLAIADGIVRRLRAADSARAQAHVPVRVGFRDVGLAVIVIAGTVLAFTGAHGRPWLRRGFQVLVIVYVGFINADLLAQTLMVGWAQNGAPWRTAPGLVLMLAAALAFPWGTGKPLYCQQLCPHGHAQELLARVAPKRWRIALPKDFAAGLRWLPALTLATILVVVMLVLPHDLAAFEPFDAYSIRAAGWATMAIAIAGLVAACFVPMAYCHYGCPTGALLNFIRSHGPADRFGRREIAALSLILFAFALSRSGVDFQEWIQSDASDWL
jgi:NosR/NirI family transcriptional regulator, nitrous oxide reductase regulator